MPEAKLSKVTLIMPRSEASEAISKISELEWFHPIKQESAYTNPDIADLLLRAQKIFQSIDDIVRNLEIPIEVGIIETMFKGTPKFDTKFTIDSIEELVDKLEREAKPLIDKINAGVEEYNKVKKELDENSTLLEAIKIVSSISLQLDKLNQFKHFYAGMFVVNSKDVDEIARSLEDIAISRIQLTEDKTALIIIGSKEDSEKIVKILRSFDSQPFTIPPTLPQVPSEAFSILSKKVDELREEEKRLGEDIAKLKVSVRSKITSLHEASRVTKDILDTMRKPSGTKNFAVIQGYVPSNMEGKLRKLSKRWVYVSEEPREDNIPVLLNNRTYIKTFEVVTETQGIPKHKEIDPTPIIAFVWPIFYGLMFGDLGHGILLFLLGMLFRVRGVGNLSKWGTLVAASGVGSAVAGLGTGEFFGFHIEEFAVLRAILAPLIDAHIIGIISVAELTFEQVSRILEISVAVGIGHLSMAFILKIIKDFKEGKKIEAGMIGIPTLIMYSAVVSLILAAIGAGYDVIGMFGVTERVHNEPVPWLTPLFGDWVYVELVAKAAVPVLFACMATIIIGHLKEEKRLKLEGKHEEGAGMVGIVMEVVLIKLIEMLSNTISYSRIAIMLLVHAILLITVNQGFEGLMEGGNAGGAITMLVGGNIGIMMIEGLIVYIQTIRLHLYEWFPKWYEGTGTQFRKIVPKMLYSSIIWRDTDYKDKDI